jgi:O-antigen/teichoic acid export membrane protein
MENTVFYLTIIICTLMGLEIKSLVIAVLIRSVVGLTAIYIANPWFPKPMFSIKSAKALLSYGLPFQGNSFLALIKDDLLVIYLGGVIGLKNLGYVTFAKKYAEFSIRIIMDNINRVAFPLFARLQHEAALLKKSLEKVLFYETALIFPMVVGAMFVFDSLVHIVPGYYLKWHLALFSFYFFSLSSFFVSLSTPFINLFNAQGKLKLSIAFMVMWTILTWLLVPWFIKLYGFNGISVAFFVMSLTFIFVFAVAKKMVKFSLLNSILIPLFSTIAMGLYLLIVRMAFLDRLHNVFLHVGFSLIGAVVVYFLTLLLLKGKKVYLELFEIIKSTNT